MLALFGELRPARGVLAIALEAKKRGRQILIVPRRNVEEAGPVQGLAAYGANSLSEVVNFLRGEAPLEAVASQPCFVPSKSDDDFAEVHGQQHVKRAVEVAAGGAHNILMIGPITYWTIRKENRCTNSLAWSARTIARRCDPWRPPPQDARSEWILT